MKEDVLINFNPDTKRYAYDIKGIHGHNTWAILPTLRLAPYAFRHILRITRL